MFDNTYAQAVPELSLSWSAAEAPSPQLLVFNDDLARELGADPNALREDVSLFLGHAPTEVPTVAQVYAGHQFGAYSPRLGDGRALLLGEVIDTHGRRRDLHLKGSGRTPFARGGDGKAAVGPMLREYLMAEAMYALGIPTTRGLSVVATGEPVMRERLLPGAVLCRVASSHLRVGTFQYTAALRDVDILRALADYAIARHYPHAADAKSPYLALLDEVVAAQADLVASWMLVGFVHGVMNTDNMTISGQTIDYGPCAFIDAYDPATVFSSIDHSGRYAFGNQPAAAQWNLSRFGETLLPLIGADLDAAVEAATEVLMQFAPRYEEAMARGMAAKLGLAAPDPLSTDLLQLLRDQRVDYTGFFRALAAGFARELFSEPEAFDRWNDRRVGLLARGHDVAEAMNRVNPVYVPRNHRVEEALAAATDGDFALFHRLLDALSRPYDERPGFEDLTGPAPTGAAPHITYCGT